jgi:hypothetical protein
MKTMLALPTALLLALSVPAVAKNVHGAPGPLVERWSRLSEQSFRVDKWSVCRG